jgi:hypothetical protein
LLSRLENGVWLCSNSFHIFPRTAHA